MAALVTSVVASVVTTSPARAGGCAPVQIKGDPGELPRAWRAGLMELVAATAREGQPWSCAGGRVAILPPTERGPAQLEVEDAFGVRRRPILRASDIVPLGEAMLATTIPIDPAGLPLAPPVIGPPPRIAHGPGGEGMPPFEPERSSRPIALGEPQPPATAPEGNRPSLMFDGLIGARYTGPTRSVLVGPEVRATYAFERWSASLVARYDSAVAVLQKVPPQFSLSSVTVGLAGGYRFLARPIELAVAVEPSLAVVLMGAQKPGESEPDVDAHVDMRLGARFAATIPLRGRLRAVCALGGEGAPAALFTDRQSRRHALPELPGYLAGISVGLEMKASP